MESNLSPQTHIVRKRPLEKLENSHRFKKRSRSIYINNQSCFKSQLQRVQKAIDSGYNVIYLHSVGSSTTRAIQIALQANEDNHDSFDLWPYTGSVKVSDDLVAITDDVESGKRERTNSSLHVKLVLKTE